MGVFKSFYKNKSSWSLFLSHHFIRSLIQREPINDSSGVAVIWSHNVSVLAGRSHPIIAPPSSLPPSIKESPPLFLSLPLSLALLIDSAQRLVSIVMVNLGLLFINISFRFLFWCVCLCMCARVYFQRRTSELVYSSAGVEERWRRVRHRSESQMQDWKVLRFWLWC